MATERAADQREPETREEFFRRTAKEVESWPAWKRGDTSTRTPLCICSDPAHCREEILGVGCRRVLGKKGRYAD